MMISLLLLVLQVSYQDRGYLVEKPAISFARSSDDVVVVESYAVCHWYSLEKPKPFEETT